MKVRNKLSEKEVKRQNIQLLVSQGMGISEVARVLKCDYKTAKKWSTREDCHHNHNTKPMKKLSPNTKRRITYLMKDKIGSSVRKCTKTLNNSEDFKSRNKTISKTCVQSYVKCKTWGKIARKLRAKPLLTPKNIRDRLTFALNVQLDGYCDRTRHGVSLRENILFTDESPIELNPMPSKQNTRIRTSDKNKTIKGVPKHPLKIMVAGGMTANGVTQLYVCPEKETIGGKVYEEKILPIYLRAINDTKLIPNKRKATMQQDSAPGHNVRPVIQKIQSTFRYAWTHGVWSGNSPDFNCIEPLWGVLQDSVFELPFPRTRDQLVARVQQKWHSLDPQLLRKLVHSFPNRIEEAINNEGRHTRY